jgi:hypothetical protein
VQSGLVIKSRFHTCLHYYEPHPPQPPPQPELQLEPQLEPDEQLLPPLQPDEQLIPHPALHEPFEAGCSFSAF